MLAAPVDPVGAHGLVAGERVRIRVALEHRRREEREPGLRGERPEQVRGSARRRSGRRPAGASAPRACGTGRDRAVERLAEHDHQHRARIERKEPRAPRQLRDVGRLHQVLQRHRGCLRALLGRVVVDLRVEDVRRDVRVEAVRRVEHLVAALCEQVGAVRRRRRRRRCRSRTVTVTFDGGQRLLLDLDPERRGVRGLGRGDVGVLERDRRQPGCRSTPPGSRGCTGRSRCGSGRDARSGSDCAKSAYEMTCSPWSERPPSPTSMFFVIEPTRLGRLVYEKFCETCSRNARTNSCWRALRCRSSSVWRKRTKSSACCPVSRW